MKILTLNHSDINGGAARAAYRIHYALRQYGIDSTMQVNEASADDWTVEGPKSKWSKVFNNIRPSLGKLLNKTLKTNNSIIHSPNIIPSYWPQSLNKSNANVLHLHWVNGEMLSIADIGKLRKPVVWTLHDMWAFCGAEHYTEDFRWRKGYTATNRPFYEKYFDLNRWAWQRKRKYWQQPIHIVTPSRWLANCAQKSRLLKGWPVTVIPNAIDTNIWQPVEKNLARQLLHLPSNIPLLLFGAMGGTKYPHKGFDLLRLALNHLRGEIPELELLIFGQKAPKIPLNLGFPIHYMGHLYDDVSLQLLYSAADVMLIPSRQDNLPNTGIEAHACGTPVVAFNICGLPDIVEHKRTGYLAEAFVSEDLAKGIQWVLVDKRRYTKLCEAARDRAIQQWRLEVVAQQYEIVYKKVIADAINTPN